MASILVVSGKSKGYYFPLKEQAVTVGRDEACDVQILDERVSRRHMQLRCDDGAKSYYASDLQSANGVFVNGQKISQESPLTDGDAITIGESKLFFSTRNFLDSDEALSHFKHRGERGKSTLIE